MLTWWVRARTLWLTRVCFGTCTRGRRRLVHGRRRRGGVVVGSIRLSIRFLLFRRRRRLPILRIRMMTNPLGCRGGGGAFR